MHDDRRGVVEGAVLAETGSTVLGYYGAAQQNRDPVTG